MLRLGLGVTVRASVRASVMVRVSISVSYRFTCRYEQFSYKMRVRDSVLTGVDQSMSWKVMKVEIIVLSCSLRFAD